MLRGRGLPSGDWLCEKRDAKPLGVFGPVSVGLRVRCRASEAAFSSRFVVPRALVEPERAEQTMAARLALRPFLQSVSAVHASLPCYVLYQGSRT